MGGQVIRLSGKKSVLDSETSKYKGSEEGGYTTCLRNSKEASVAGEQ